MLCVGAASVTIAEIFSIYDAAERTTVPPKLLPKSPMVLFVSALFKIVFTAHFKSTDLDSREVTSIKLPWLSPHPL